MNPSFLLDPIQSRPSSRLFEKNPFDYDFGGNFTCSYVLRRTGHSPVQDDQEVNISTVCVCADRERYCYHEHECSEKEGCLVVVMIALFLAIFWLPVIEEFVFPALSFRIKSHKFLKAVRHRHRLKGIGRNFVKGTYVSFSTFVIELLSNRMVRAFCRLESQVHSFIGYMGRLDAKSVVITFQVTLSGASLFLLA